MRPQVSLVVLSLGVVLAVLCDSADAIPAPRGDENANVVCKLPMVRGHCRALLPRWRYDPATGKCHEFKFGGCDGNGNNFMSEQECMQVCAGV